MADWNVILRPEQQHLAKGENRSGLAVLITDGEDEVEVTRVAFARDRSKNPDVSFEEQLDAELDKAEKACEVVNDFLIAERDLREGEQADALQQAREKVREIMGRRSTVPA